MSSLPSSQSSDDDDIHSHRTPSSSRRVLAQVLARKERDAQQMHHLLKLTLAKLDEQSQRATDAERRATECLVRARTAMDARAQSDADAAAARTELALYKMQLEQAQREISRAQEYLDGLEARRHDAEEDAARARSVARKLQEERAVEAAREQGKQLGYDEGLRRGILLGRRESDNNRQPRSRRRQEEDHDWRPQSRQRRPADVHFTQVIPEPPQQSPSERSFLDDQRHHIVTGLSPEQPIFPNAVRNDTPDEQPYDSPSLSPSPPQRSRSRSQSRPRLLTPAPEPAHSRPYAPQDGSTPSIIQPIPILASASPIGPLSLHLSPSSSPRHPSVRIPPDNWIPRAQDTAGDGRLSIFLPPPHELMEPVRSNGAYAIVETPEEGSPAVVPPPPILSSSPGPRNRRSPDYTYGTPPPPDLGPAMRNPNASRSRDYLYAATPPPPDLGPATAPRTRDIAAQQPFPPPPPPELAPVTSDERAFMPPQQIATNNSRGSTHLSEFDLLAPVSQPPRMPNIGPPPDEEDELEYTDAQTEPMPRHPIAPDPPMQRRRAQVVTRPTRGPTRPRNIVFPAPLSQAPAQPVVPSQSRHMPPQQYGMYMERQPPPPVHVQDEEEDEDAPVHVTATPSRPKRTHTQSSIGIKVESPSPENSPPSSDNKIQRRWDLLSPEYAVRNLPTFMGPKPSRGEEQQQQLGPLPELAGLAPNFGGAQAPELVTNAGKESRSRRHTRSHKHLNSAPLHAYGYEAAPLPAGMEYPSSPLQQPAGGVNRSLPAPPMPARIPVPMSVAERMLMGDTMSQMSPLSSNNNVNVAPSSGFLGLGLKGRLPWRRNTAK